MSGRNENQPQWLHGGRRLKRDLVRLSIHLLGLVGMTVIFYAGFSFFFDTPIEYRMKRSTAMLEKQYRALNRRYDSLKVVLDNVVERDRNVFHILFEAEPYDIDGQSATSRWEAYEKLLTKSNRELGDEFISRTTKLEQQATRFENTFTDFQDKACAKGDALLYIPAIQPVINNQLTLLTASYGMRIHPFYKTLTSHQGVDYTVPEGSSVFATADGTVKDIVTHSTSGLTLVVSHGNNYETMYAHLGKLNVSKGERVRRGDIVALTGNSGLSLAPHLHYEILYRGMRVDPIHYFFMELSPADYRKIARIAQSGMQSFD